LNRRPSGYEPDELPGCSTPQHLFVTAIRQWSGGSECLIPRDEMAVKKEATREGCRGGAGGGRGASLRGTMARDARCADVTLRDDGIVVVRVHPGVRQAVENAQANLVAAIAVRGGVTRPILVDITGCEPLEPEVRKVYAGKAVVSSFSAVGMLVEASAFGRMIGNIYLRIASLGVPTQLFTDKLSALAWLRLFSSPAADAPLGVD
jgi:hypothetical protein